MVLVNMHRTGERKENLLFISLPMLASATPHQVSANFQASHTQSGGSARPFPAWFLPHAVRMSEQREQRPGQGKKAPGRRIQQ